LAPASSNSFDWVVDSRPQAQIVIDSQAHSGHGSLRITFRAPNTLEKIPLSQTVIVEPGAQYRFECYTRTEALFSASTPIMEIRDAVDLTLLAGSNPLPTGTNDWQQITFAFKTTAKHDGIILGFRRAACAESQICPIFGTVWYDDFNLKRVDTPGSPRGASGSAKH